MDEAERCRVDAIAQPAAIRRAVGKDVAEMAVAMCRAHLGADHAERGVLQLVDVGRLDRLGEARPAAARFEFVGRREQGLARHDVDVDAGLLVVEIRAGAGALGAALLGHAILLGRQAGNGFLGLAIIGHLSPFRRNSWSFPPGLSRRPPVYASCFCPVSEARTIMSMRRCRVAAASKVGTAAFPPWMFSASFT